MDRPSDHGHAAQRLDERRAEGAEWRRQVPHSAQAEWKVLPDRADPVEILIGQGKTRIAELIPIRYARMKADPFAFLRGAVAIMAADLAPGPATGLHVQACGDCHLANFGAYAAPEGTPVFDVNDFDEMLAACFEWDVKRLAVSLAVAGRVAGASDREARQLARTATKNYRRHLGRLARITAVLDTWGSAMTHHPHVHMIVPGGGISLDGAHWVRCKPGFLLPVRVLSRLFRRLFLTRLADAHAAGRLVFFGELDGLRGRQAFAAHLAPLNKKKWFVYAKSPFAGPEAVLAYLARYTHRVAISNSRLVGLHERGITFRYKDYRSNGRERFRTMTLAPGEFIRRFLLHVLPNGFHRIRHYGLLASATCKANIARARELIAAPVAVTDPPAEHDDADLDASAAADHRPLCPCCGGRMIIVESFGRGGAPRGPPSPEAAVRATIP